MDREPGRRDATSGTRASTPRSALRRALRLPHATALVVGTIIGASIFVQPSEMIARMPSAAGVAGVWAAAGVLTLFGALVCAKLVAVYPESGGVYAFLRETLSPAVGFLWGWAMFWTMHTGIIAAIAVIFARYAAYFVPLGDAGLKLAAITCVVALSAVNYAGVKYGGTLQAIVTCVKVLAILLMIVAGLTLAPSSVATTPELTPAAVSGAPSAPGVPGFLLALVAGLFAFGGWHMVTYSAEETLEARRTVPRALLLGTLIVTTCYILLNAVYMRVLPLDRIAGSTRVAADAADVLVGSGGAALMSGLVVISSFGALNGIILAGPRVYFAMARDGLLFPWLGGIHPQFHTPHRAILIQAAWTVVLILTGTYRALFTRVVYTEWIFFALMAVGLIRLRGRLSAGRGRPGRWITTIAAGFALAAAAIVVNQVIAEPRESLAGLAMVLAGAPVYALWTRRTSHQRKVQP